MAVPIKKPRHPRGTTGPLEARAGWGAKKPAQPQSNIRLRRHRPRRKAAVGRFGAQRGRVRSMSGLALAAFNGSSPSVCKKGRAAFAVGANERERLGGGGLAFI